jgi:AcrR family transcriptional regulator
VIVPNTKAAAAKTPRKITLGAAAQTQILDAVDALFYREGARAVGVDAVVKRAGVNKMSLYRQFQSKDDLLLHYLARRDDDFWAYIDASIAKHPGAPKQQLWQIFADVAQRAQRPAYRGCPFVNIAAEFPDRGHAARQFVAKNKAELIERFNALASAAHAANPAQLADGLALLLEGAYAASQTYESERSPLASLPDIAALLINAATPQPPR